ncbi:hypothetical protein [Levilactobacillus brevis]|uniref:hypothetical protein n=1 Tax=Levilactobacillus brevis TaxID=1580 RepID=UPI000BE7F142|nr:hypothetical protein [Levilactobacillus brevis]STX19367.1 Uncharacterised protein [Levilactobacillus brevis]
MGLEIQGKKISGLVIGNEYFTKPNYAATWLECPDEGVEGQDFKGQTLMKWDAATNTATFKSNATVNLPEYYTPTLPASRLAITLPDGFRFLDNGGNATFYGHYSMNGVSTQSAGISIQGNKLYCRITNGYQNTNPYFICKITNEGLITLESEVTFNVGKI